MSEGAPVQAGSSRRPAIEVEPRVMSEAAEPGAPGDATSVEGRIEAILLCAERPVSVSRLALALGLSATDTGMTEGGTPALPDESGRSSAARKSRAARRAAGGDADGAAQVVTPGKIITSAIEGLNRAYDQTGRSFRIEAVAGGYRIMTLAAYGSAVRAYQGAKQQGSLSRAAIETLAIVAYKQPITRATLEAIRGVACGDVLRSLLERRLVTISGRAEELGRPMLYETTRQFLEVFGLATLKDLPSMDEFRGRADGAAVPSENED